jgi:hypothetical protein
VVEYVGVAHAVAAVRLVVHVHTACVGVQAAAVVAFFTRISKQQVCVLVRTYGYRAGKVRSANHTVKKQYRLYRKIYQQHNIMH